MSHLDGASIMDPALFPYMLDSSIMEFASPFVDQEVSLVHTVTRHITEVSNLIAVGDARLIYGSVADAHHLNYVCIDPEAGVHGWSGLATAHGGWAIRRRLLHEVKGAELPPGPSLWLLHFNIYSYLPGLRIPRGDHVLVSAWTDSARGRAVRERYDRRVAALAATRTSMPFSRARSAPAAKSPTRLTYLSELAGDVVTVAHYRAEPFSAAGSPPPP
ncbi:hypothetical protein [Streptomyces sp. OE57]|uniref:hypothetical protein n=1 Tax=Streptomyces lacaronensis TaxID=3379885 RepID=UPI0039B76CD5